MSELTSLRALVSIMADAVDTIERVYAEKETALPSLDGQHNPRDASEMLRVDSEVALASRKIIAAAAQITAEVRSPIETIALTAVAFHSASALRITSELNVVEVLREAGPEGMHVKELGEICQVDPGTLAANLRLLATGHIFRELAPGVFTNNLISSTMDKGKPSVALFANRQDRLVGSNGVAALVEWGGDECFKASAALGDALLDPMGERNPVKRALRFREKSLFEWFSRPENKFRYNRFGLAMLAITPESAATFGGFDWGALPPDAVVVDVGSGMAETSLAISRKHRHLRIVAQDLPTTMEAARRHWLQYYPEHVERGMVEFQAHDFFNPQPPSVAADVFMIRHCLHNWATDPAVTILQNLRNAVAKPSTKLVVIESILPAVSGGESHDPRTSGIPGAVSASAPPPLLPNGGAAAARLYSMNMTLQNMTSGGKRTVAEYVELLDKAGWRMTRIYRVPGTETCHIVADPMEQIA
ncbi:hypothetical protein MKEN_01320300 [Mycena kentingensis (nom. inval.)]|nr:hypothetical protein MKEN_01320300 [Mycena kentingensis (nom. inval.)]